MKAYIALLWHVMSVTGKGYHRPSMRHTGEDEDRRKDKLRAVEYVDDEGKQRINYVPFDQPERKFQRSARLHQLTVR